MDEIIEENVAKQTAYLLGEQSGLEKGLSQGISQGLEKGLKQGILQGLKQKEKEMVINMVNKKYEFKDIAEITGLKVEELNNIIQEIK